MCTVVEEMDIEVILTVMDTTELVVEIRPVSWTIERYFLMTKTLTRIDHTLLTGFKSVHFF